jgi:hypothetical protein
VKQKLRFLVVIALAVAIGTASLHAQEEKKETLGDKLKKLFVRPTPTPTPRKKHKAVASSATETANSPSNSSPQESATSASETIMPVTTVTPDRGTQTKGETQYFEAVRPIGPGPSSGQHAAPKTIYAPQTSPIPTSPPTSETMPEEGPESRPMPSLPSSAESTSSPTENKSGAENAEVVDTTSYPPKARKLLISALNLPEKIYRTSTLRPIRQVAEWIARVSLITC